MKYRLFVSTREEYSRGATSPGIHSWQAEPLSARRSGHPLTQKIKHPRVLGVLKNPCYAGAYVHGRYISRRRVDPDGTVHTGLVERPRAEWPVLIRVIPSHGGGPGYRRCRGRGAGRPHTDGAGTARAR